MEEHDENEESSSIDLSICRLLNSSESSNNTTDMSVPNFNDISRSTGTTTNSLRRRRISLDASNDEFNGSTSDSNLLELSRVASVVNEGLLEISNLNIEASQNEEYCQQRVNVNKFF